MNAETNRAIAEYLGWRDIKNEFGDITGIPPNSGYRLELPNWHDDLNACHEMEKALTCDERRIYPVQLRRIVLRDFKAEGHEREIDDTDFYACKASQKTEAFCRTVKIGKWKGQR